MPPSYNHFQDAQEEFWKTVLEHFEESQIHEFRAFFVPLFFLDESVSVHSSSHPINKYGRDVATSINVEALHTTVAAEFTGSCPDDLMQYMFEESDHDISEALYQMIRKYKELGAYLRDDSSDSD